MSDVRVSDRRRRLRYGDACVALDGCILAALVAEDELLFVLRAKRALERRSLTPAEGERLNRMLERMGLQPGAHEGRTSRFEKGWKMRQMRQRQQPRRHR